MSIMSEKEKAQASWKEVDATKGKEKKSLVSRFITGEEAYHTHRIYGC